jgi:hypothetical protein
MKEKNMKKIFFCIRKVTEERSRIRIQRHGWIRTKMSRVPNTARQLHFFLLRQHPLPR